MATDNDKDYADKFPECTKIAAHHDNLMALRNFVAWLYNEKKFDVFGLDVPHVITESSEDLFAEFYGIDNKAAELERQQMIQEMQE